MYRGFIGILDGIVIYLIKRRMIGGISIKVVMVILNF